MRLLASGRDADVFDLGDGRVLKVDHRSKSKWNSPDRYRVLGAMADWNTKMIEEFRAKGGVGLTHPFGDRILLLTTTGAKTGRRLTAPVVYHRDGDRYIIAASKGGAPTHPGWYHNVVKHKEATVEVGTEKFKARATPLPIGPERDRLYAAHAEIMPGFRDYETKTKRIIPVVALERIAS